MELEEITDLIDPIKNVLKDNDYELLDEAFVFENYLIGFKKNGIKLSIHIINQM